MLFYPEGKDRRPSDVDLMPNKYYVTKLEGVIRWAEKHKVRCEMAVSEG